MTNNKIMFIAAKAYKSTFSINNHGSFGDPSPAFLRLNASNSFGNKVVAEIIKIKLLAFPETLEILFLKKSDLINLPTEPERVKIPITCITIPKSRK